MGVFNVNGDYWHKPKDPSADSLSTPTIKFSMTKAIKTFWLNKSKDDLSACFKDHVRRA